MRENHGRSRWFAFFQVAGFIFCFLVFPIFVLNSSLMSFFELKQANHRQQTLSELSTQLDRLEPYNDERRYFHLLLQKIFTFSEQSNHPADYLDKAIARLKKNHPGRFEFVVWDKSGEIIDKLTDEKRFRFVIKKLWVVMNAVSDHVASSDPTPIKNLPVVKSNQNLLRQFLGRVFLPETLVSPWLTDEKASLILADYGRTRPYFWYHVGRTGGLMVFLSWDAVNDNCGVRAVVRSMNRANPDVTVGIASLLNFTEPYLCRNRHLQNEVVMALARFENSAESMIETDQTQIVIQMLNSSTMAFAVHEKDEEIYDHERRRNRIVTQAVTIYLLGLSILFFNFWVRCAFFSIRWKLLFLFLYANVAPLVVLAAISYDYLQNKKVSLRNDVVAEMDRVLREIDARYQEQTEEFSVNLNAMIDSINRETRVGVFDIAQLDMLKQKIAAFLPSEAFLVDRHDRLVFAFDENGKAVNYSNTYIKNLASSILQFHNRVNVGDQPVDDLSKIISAEESDFIRDSIRDSQKIWPMSFGDTKKLAYWNMIGKPKERQNNYVLLLFWDDQRFQQMFLRSHQQDLLAQRGLVHTFAIAGDSSKLFPEIASGSDVIEQFLRSTKRGEGKNSSLLSYAGNEYVACGMRGRNMNKTSFVALYPVAELEAEIAGLRRSMLGGAAISLLVTLIIGLAVSRQFLVPVRALEHAGNAIARHQFKHRIQIADHDEFGHLGQVMNRVIDGLGELEIARIVQESLFPEEVLNTGSFIIFGKSQTVTTLGGDFFDYFVIDEHHCGVIIGEVTGRGVVAALLIAMLKAGVRMANVTELLDPVSLTRKLNGVIWELQRQNLDHLVTFQYLVLNHVSGESKMVNAGHCFPILLNHLLRKSVAIEQVAFPLGAMQNPDYQKREFSLTAGETLILYTDGAIAAKTTTQAVVPPDIFSESALHHFDSDPEKFCSILLAASKASNGKLIDDTTFVFVNAVANNHA